MESILRYSKVSIPLIVRVSAVCKITPSLVLGIYYKLLSTMKCDTRALIVLLRTVSLVFLLIRYVLSEALSGTLQNLYV